ncbi:hypothetical protein CRG98_003738 [Punica granatum]|uniref:Uncharacterized protein n=1 Tax=Punica granatum TaxID=22663 RepID=A0A2I0L5C5_PUNGR|nr:hypothetical protein CRG98_003738 [Punica granatum]
MLVLAAACPRARSRTRPRTHPRARRPVREHARPPNAPARTLARSSAPPVCPACLPACPRASVHSRTCILCTRASFQGFYRVTRLSNTSPTLSSYPEASMSGNVWIDPRKTFPTRNKQKSSRVCLKKR